MTPRATYRLQFSADFRFADAAALAPYLAELGISHVYASPVFAARPGSTHGYDVVDPTRLNPELGSEADFRAMAAALRAQGLGLILDVVPNHMGIGGAANAYWLDVLEWGQESRFAGWFDIDWSAPHPGLAGKVLAPVLGDAYGDALAAGSLELRLDADNGGFAVWAHDTHKLPVCPRHYGRILRAGGLDALANAAEAAAGAPPGDPRWAELCAGIVRAATAGATGPALAAYQGRSGDAASWAALDALIAEQHWRAAKFSLDSDAINYRRFFTISDLAGLRVEDPAVFEATHGLVLGLLTEGVIDGLRVDHIDGLRDPKAYVRRLRERAGCPFYLLVEKILAPDEALPADWGVDGTTGYEVTNLLVGLLVDPAGSEALSRGYAAFVGYDPDPDAIVREAKRAIMARPMAAEIEALTGRLLALAGRDGRYRDLGRGALRTGLIEVVAALDVYRTYVDTDGIGAEDRARIEAAVADAQVQAPGLDPGVFDFLGAVLGLGLAADRPDLAAEVREAVLRAQQVTGPVMAKGLEDTALFRYNRLIALNEVGSKPGEFGVPLAAFHTANAARTPGAMLTTSTHDTKRGEDARARIAALGRHAALWGEKVAEWHTRLADPARPIDRNEEYLFYQLLLGAWPADWRADAAPSPEALRDLAGRVEAAMLKSAREAGVNTRWAFGDPGYEAALSAFVARALDPAPSNGFLASFRAVEAIVAPDGAANGLIQTALKLTIPGVPDIYQGAELPEQSLVDPDNRRPVDFAARAALLARPRQAPAAPAPDDPAAKLALTTALLGLRRDKPALFAGGSYEPLAATGPAAATICAFARRHNSDVLVVAVALRHTLGPGADDAPARIASPRAAAGPWRDILTGGTRTDLVAPDRFAALPVAVLLGTGL